MYQFKFGETSVKLRVKIRDSTTGLGKTGLAFNTAGLIISTAADNEATPVVYTGTGATLETIATLGTWAAPTATKARFKEYDATNHKGIYELQFADARFAVASSKGIIISWSGTGVLDEDIQISLTDVDPYSRLRNQQVAISGTVAAVGSLPTFDQAIYDIRQALYEPDYSGGTNVVIRGVDHVTTIHTLTLDASPNGTRATQAT